MARCSLLKSHCGTIRATSANIAGLRFLLGKAKGGGGNCQMQPLENRELLFFRMKRWVAHIKRMPGPNMSITHAPTSAHTCEGRCFSSRVCVRSAGVLLPAEIRVGACSSFVSL